MFAIFANFAMDCEFGNGCEFDNVVCEFGKAIANLAMWFANLAMWFAKLAMRNFAKLLKVFVRSEVRNVLCNRACEFGKVVCEVGKVVCEVGNGCQLIANRLPISQWLPTDCQLIAKISALLFFQNMLQNLKKKLLN